ncbi:MAG: hypothetical protein P8129_15070 [Anaerolineae bacterium]
MLITLLSIVIIPPIAAGTQAQPRTPSRFSMPQLTAGTRWRIERVESDRVGNPNSLALDGDGWPHISYYDHETKDLKYARKDGSGWHIETVDPYGEVGEYNSLALDAGDEPHIAYYDRLQGNLKYAYHDAGGWHFEIADGEFADVGQYCSLALDEHGQPHISYYDVDNGNLKYAYKDAGGTPHISTVDSAAADVGRYTSLALGWGHRYISYFDNTNKDLKYAHYDGATWSVETLDADGDVGYYSSLDLCRTYEPGAPRIIYWADGQLKYAHKYFFGGWGFAALNQEAPAGISHALSDTCQPRISYFELYGGDLRYTYQGLYGWESETVDAEGDSWPYGSSLALDAAGRPHISYYDDSHFGLSYAYQVYVAYLPNAQRHP